MGTFISDTRSDLAERLTAAHEEGLTVYDYMPERMNVPCAIILHGSPLLEDGAVFGTVNLRFTVVLVPGVGSNDVNTAELTALIETSVIALHAGDFGTEIVSQPYMLSANGGTYLAADATVVTVTNIN